MNNRIGEWIRLFLRSDGFKDFAVWVGFSFLISLSPFWVSWLSFGIFGLPFQPWKMIQAGELLLVCCGLAGAGIGDVFKKTWALVRLRAPQRHGWYYLASLSCVATFMLIVTISVLLYGGVKTATEMHHYQGKTLVTYTSIVMFVATVISAAMCAAITRSSPRGQ